MVGGLCGSGHQLCSEALQLRNLPPPPLSPDRQEPRQAEDVRASNALAAADAAQPPPSAFVELLKQHKARWGFVGQPSALPRDALPPKPAPVPTPARRPAQLSPFGWRPPNPRAVADRREAEILAAVARLEALGTEAA